MNLRIMYTHTSALFGSLKINKIKRADDECAQPFGAVHGITQDGKSSFITLFYTLGGLGG
jgi:hypothetical protein